MLSLGKIAHNLSEFRQNFILAWIDAWGWLFVRSLLLAGLAVNVLNWIGANLLFRNLAQDLTVLHYNVNFGIDLIGTRGQIFLNPLLGLIFLLLNLILILLLTKSKHFKFLAHILLNAALVANILLLLAEVAVYLINFR